MQEVTKPQIVKEWSDGDTVFAVLYDDGVILVSDEKAAATISVDGNVTEKWWKEEPCGVYYDVFIGRSPLVEEPVSDELSETISSAARAEPGAAAKLRDMLTGTR